MGEVIKGNFEKKKTERQLLEEAIQIERDRYRFADNVASWLLMLEVSLLMFVVTYVMLNY